MASSTKRFAQTTPEEMIGKRVKINSANTIKSNIKASRILKDYLTEKQQPANFEEYDEVRLNETLCHFYMDVRKPDGGKYKVTSFENIRHSLNRYLRSPPYCRKFNIIKDSSFSDANQNFAAALAELKRIGNGHVTHHPVINEADRHKLYTSVYLNPCTPSGLYNKVQFDIRLYFFRRGSENMHSMTKSTFQVKTNPKTGLKYVIKATDELTKNHRESDKEKTSPTMPESQGSPYFQFLHLNHTWRNYILITTACGRGHLVVLQMTV